MVKEKEIKQAELINQFNDSISTLNENDIALDNKISKTIKAINPVLDNLQKQIYDLQSELIRLGEIYDSNFELSDDYFKKIELFIRENFPVYDDEEEKEYPYQEASEYEDNQEDSENKRDINIRIDNLYSHIPKK